MASASRKRKAPQRMLGDEPTKVIVGKKARKSWGQRALGRRPTKSRKVENKFLDTTQAAVEVNFDATHAVCLNVITQGDTVSTRDGNKIKVTGVQVKGKINWGSESVTNATILRMILAYDKRANLGGVLNMSNILTTGGTAADPYQLRNRGTGLTDRFKVLKDELYARCDVGVSVDTNTEDASQCFEWFIPLNAFVEYGANAGASTDIQVGLIGIYATSSIAAAGSGPTIEYRARVSFEDM